MHTGAGRGADAGGCGRGAARVGPQGVLAQAERYSRGIPLMAMIRGDFGVPFLYSTNGEQIHFHDVRREQNGSRTILGFHAPGAFAEMLRRDTDAGPEGVSVLQLGNIQVGAIDLAVLKYMTVDTEAKRLMLQYGYLLFNWTNSPELVGKSAVWRGSSPATFASYLIRVRFHNQATAPEFVNYWIGSAWGRIWAHQVKTDGVSQSNINGTKLGAMPIPLPPIAEQREIVRRVEAALRASKQILAQVGVASNLLGNVRQAVLAKAFRGELLRVMK